MPFTIEGMNQNNCTAIESSHSLPLPRSTTFSLWFTCSTDKNGNIVSASLEKTEFFTPSREEVLLAFRGRTTPVNALAGTFQWSPAVRALASLMLRTAAWAGEEPPLPLQPILEGEGGTPASSLDYALGKQPVWLRDMFGVDREGNTLARRLIRRSNPERRRPGPVSLSVNTRFLEQKRLRIYVENALFTDAAILEQLAGVVSKQPALSQVPPEGKSICDEERPLPAVRGIQLLDPHSEKEGQKRIREFLAVQEESGPLPSPFHCDEHRNFLAEVFHREIHEMLHAVDIFSRYRLDRILRNIRSRPSFLKTAGKSCPVISDLDLNLSGSSRFGLLGKDTPTQKLFPAEKPFRMLVPCCHASTLAIFKYLRYHRNMPFEVSTHFAHSTELARHMVFGEHITPTDAFVVNCAAASYVWQHRAKHEYIPLMLLPGISHKVVAPPSADMALKGAKEYHFMWELPTLASFYLEDLQEHKIVSKKNTRVIEAEPCDISALLREGDPLFRAIQPFPHYHLSSYFDSCQVFDKIPAGAQGNVSIFFVHEKLFRDNERSKLLDMIVRDAWLHLRERPTLVDNMVELLMGDRDYVRFLKRAGGVHAHATVGAG